MNIKPIYLPQVSVNDINAKIVEWKVNDNTYVELNQIICTIETTKSLFDVESNHSGYIKILKNVGDDVNIGEIIAAISEIPWKDNYSLAELIISNENNEENLTDDIVITEKAKILAKRLNIDIKNVTPKNGKITEKEIEEYSKNLKDGKISLDVQDIVNDIYPSNKIVKLGIIGAGDGAVQVLDLISKVNNIKAVALFDDNKALHGKYLSGVKVYGGIKGGLVEKLFEEKFFDGLVISISTSIKVRKMFFEHFSNKGIPFFNVIHPSTSIGMNVQIGNGNVILANCQIGACAKIGDNNFISAFCNIEHHNQLGNHCSFGPGVVTSSKVVIEDEVRFGTGIFIEPFIRIGKKSIISSGCIIWKDIPENSIAKSELNFVIRDLSN